MTEHWSSDKKYGFRADKTQHVFRSNNLVNLDLKERKMVLFKSLRNFKTRDKGTFTLKSK